MGNVLIIGEFKDGALKKTTRAAFTFAKEYTAKQGGEFHILLLGKDLGPVTEEAMCYGAAKVHVADNADLEAYMAETHGTVVAKVAQDMGAEVVAATASAMTKDLLPRVAGKLEAGMASDILGITDEGYFQRPVWAGNAIVAAEVTSAVKVVSVRGTEFEPLAKGDSGGDKVDVAVELPAINKRFLGFDEVKSDRPELTEATIIVSGGRGSKGEEGFKLVEGLADLLGAAVGATRAAVDAGWVPNDLQVGQTGKVVAPDLYVAAGISGAIQHLAGMKGSKTIVAINKDEEAPIFTVADYGLVADMFKALPEMVEEIKKAKA